MTDAVIFCSGGPITWKSVCQERNSFSSREADIHATIEASRLTVVLCNLAAGMPVNGYPLYDTNLSADVLN